MKINKYFIYLLINLVLCSCSVPDAQSGAKSGVQVAGIIHFKQSADTEIIEINASNTTSRKVFLVPNPERLVVDLPSVNGKPSVSLPDNYKGSLIKAARFGQFDPKTSRFVFDLNRNVRIVSTQVEGKKLVIEIDDASSNKEKKPKQKQIETLEKPENPPEKITQKTEKSEKPKKEPKVYKNIKWDQPPLIMIDAGHGGIDPGAIGDGGTKEKDIVLDYAHALKARLVKTKKYRVRLTRSTDEFIRLRDRVAMARKADASIFISIHADSAEASDARGLSVYTVSEKASDKEAEALAARENKSDIIAGMDLSDEKPEVADILISLAQRETKNNSATLADYLIMNMDEDVRLLENTHRFAGFAVLKAPDIPSVLVEVGFLSHAQDEKNIKSKTYRNKVIEGLARGIDEYFRKKGSFGQGGL